MCVFFFTCAGSGNFAWPGAEKELKHSRHSSQAVWLSSALFDLVWLVVLTILKNISQWEGLSNHQPPKWNMEKNMFQTTKQLSFTTLYIQALSAFLGQVI